MKSVSVLYHYTRCGSTVLADAIGNHPDVLSMGEILNPSSHHGESLSSNGRNSVSISAIANLLQEQWNENKEQHLLFEITSYDRYMGRLAASLTDLLDYLACLHTLHVVHLIRHNVFERFLSGKIAEVSKLWHVRSDEQQVVNKVKIDLAVNDIIAAVWSDSAEVMRDKCLFEPFSPLPLEYESHIRDDVNVASSMFFRHIGVQGAVVRSGFRRLPRPEERIENWTEIREAVISAGLSDFLR